MKKLWVIVLLGLVLASCEEAKEAEFIPGSFQTISLLGDSLFVPDRSQESLDRLLNNLDEAQNNFDTDPSELNTIWLGRRWAYLGDYRTAIKVYSEGLKDFPASYRLYRHRGHRFVSLREFDKAISDFEKAYELMPKDAVDIEPDGIPNRINQPLSNTQFNVMYHWGLAHYLKGEFEEAYLIYLECMDYSVNNDLVIATSDWLYMTLRRLEKEEEALQVLSTITPDMEIIENSSYHKRLLMYSGTLPIDSLFSTLDDDAQLSLTTQGYGVANWYLYNGDTLNAVDIYQDILESSSWSPFGYIAAEADMAILNE